MSLGILMHEGTEAFGAYEDARANIICGRISGRRRSMRKLLAMSSAFSLFTSEPSLPVEIGGE